MLMHTVTASFFKISREIRNQERRGLMTDSDLQSFV
ncbi:hypothetical protein T10_7225 [Trichinella papuae]|uniref:Uncharacterized protein n=1 Tax=Trichinella papuae TaxID=268474 RepID=A0A0V1M029_9BILA|nr:hypothetical protein T10_7225 [Trichinella papuae]